ncbi:hypothetical protein ACGTN9_09300 [Halobacillus sp. MO56]
MKSIVEQLRKNNKVYLITLISVMILMIGSAALTSISLIWGQRLILFFLSVMLYLMVFLGVNPIFKGIIFTLIPIALGEIFTELLEFVPEEFYQKWLEADTVRGGSPASLSFILFIVLVVKLSKVKPYFQQLEEQAAKHKNKR